MFCTLAASVAITAYNAGMRSVLITLASLPACQTSLLDRPDDETTAQPDVSHDADTTIDTIGQGDCAESHPVIAVNELLSANLNGLVDAHGDTSDWIELINLSEAPVQMEDWSLSAGSSGGWLLPDLTLKPGGIVLVYASGKESIDSELHADFSLSAEGEAVQLSAPDGCIIERLDAVRLFGDISYGRPADSPEALSYFLEPTPGAANTTESRPGFAATPLLDPAPGFYVDDIVVTATSEVADALWVTLDGAAPDASSTLYEGAIALDAVSQPVVVRVRASADGLWPSQIATGTYSQSPAILEDGLKVVSLVVDPFDLYDEETGIYAYGLPDYTAYYPYFGANFWEDWERDLHIEVFETDGHRVLAQDAGVKIHGGYTRAFDQKNFRVLARPAYGPGALDYGFFPDESLDSYKVIVLEGVGDWCPTHTENALIDVLFRDEDGVRFPTIDSQAWEPAALYLNGEFWGLYAFREKLDEHYIAAHHGFDSDNLDRIECTADGTDDWWRVSQGDWEEFDALEEFLNTHDLADPDAWAQFETMVDVDNLATAVLAEGYWGNTDWWSNNLKLWRAREPDAQWRWMVFDLGHGWGSYTYDHIGTSAGFSGPGLPISDALRNDAFRILLANQASDLLNTSLSVDTALARLDEMHARIEPLIAEQYAKWCGQPESYWHGLVAYARQFVQERTAIMRAQVVTHLGLSGTTSVTLDAEPSGSGSFRLTLVEVEAPFTGIFFTGIPVTITALPAEGQAFAGWSDEALGDDATATITLTGSQSITAYFESE
ncbi:MAG: hypothetical protein ACI8RZ_001271 [Myxococcota bacterium]